MDSRHLQPILVQPVLGGALETLVDKAGQEWTVRLRRDDGSLYTLSRGKWWDPKYPGNKEWELTVGTPMQAAQERILRLWQATPPESLVRTEAQK